MLLSPKELRVFESSPLGPSILRVGRLCACTVLKRLIFAKQKKQEKSGANDIPSITRIELCICYVVCTYPMVQLFVLMQCLHMYARMLRVGVVRRVYPGYTKPGCFLPYSGIRYPGVSRVCALRYTPPLTTAAKRTLAWHSIHWRPLMGALLSPGKRAN